MPSRIFKVGIEVEGTLLTPLRLVKRPRNTYTGTYYLFKCRCGNEKVIRKNNVKAGYHSTKSCGCLQKENRKNFGKTHKTNRKGLTPWNKGLKGMKSHATGHPNLSWKKGKVMLRYPNGKIEWVKVSNEAIGSQSKFYERHTRQKRHSLSSDNPL